jgi:type III restriction enzyme
MEEYYRKKNAPSTEKKFEDMLNASSQIDWWYKNGEKMERYFAVEYSFLDKNAKSRRAAFYPDYIIRFNDGMVGIYDTKAGFTTDNEHTRQKAEALQRYIREHADLNLKGGIIKVERDSFYLQDSEEYDQDGEWKPFEV